MAVAALLSSHSPLIGLNSPGGEIEIEVKGHFEQLKKWVADFKPDLIIELAPDHFNGFFYKLMPSFCIGVEASSVADYGTPAGPLPINGPLAEKCVAYMHQQGIDVAISYAMRVDHGLTQLPSMLFGWDKVPAMIPVFINCAAPPRPPIQRVIKLGEAIGQFAAELDCNVLIMGSGGLSHDPPVPALKSAAPEVRQRLIAGGELSPEARALRQERTLEEGIKSAAGKSDILDINPEWDHQVLELLEKGDFETLAGFDDADISRLGGRGGHEIRSWVAGCAALNAIGPYTAKTWYYRPIPEWIAGFGIMTAELN
ncbi:MAG: 3-carboxyethylcatechol 2,3-dioxygenase [Porticoccaceae bacterium]